MKLFRKYLLLPLLFFSLQAKSQERFASREIPVHILYNYRTLSFMIRQDSILKVYDGPLIEVESLAIKFSKAYYDSHTELLRLTGTVFFYDTNSVAMPGIPFYKAIRDSVQDYTSALLKMTFVGQTEGKIGTASGGKFDISFSLARNERIMLWVKHFYVLEFDFRKMLDDMFPGKNPF